MLTIPEVDDRYIMCLRCDTVMLALRQTITKGGWIVFGEVRLNAGGGK